MKLKELISFFEQVASFSFQESYDNSGLQTGDPGYGCQWCFDYPGCH